MSKLAVAALCTALFGTARVLAQEGSAPAVAPASGIAIVNYAEADPKPAMLSSVRPVYPPDLRSAGIEGNAVVDFVVDSNGIPTRIHIYRQTRAEFGFAAMESIARWRFTPGGKNGSPAWVHMQIPMSFSLGKDAAKSDGRVLPPMPDLARNDPVFDVGNVSVVPVPVFQTRPQYPQRLRASGVSGSALISFVVRTNGRVSNVTVVSATEPLFGAAGIEAVRRWTFHPARQGSQAVNCQLRVPLDFSLHP